MTIGSTLVLCGFVVEAGYAAQVTLKWEQNKKSNLAGYKVYFDTKSINNNGQNGYRFYYVIPDKNKTKATISNLNSGTKYYFAVTAYNYKGKESNYSKEIQQFSFLKQILKFLPLLELSIYISNTINVKLLLLCLSIVDFG